MQFLINGQRQRVSGVDRIMQICFMSEIWECWEIYGVPKGNSLKLKMHSLIKMKISPNYEEREHIAIEKHSQTQEHIVYDKNWYDPIIYYQIAELTNTTIDTIQSKLSNIQIPFSHMDGMYDNWRGYSDSWRVTFGDQINEITVNWYPHFVPDAWEEFVDQIIGLSTLLDSLISDEI